MGPHVSVSVHVSLIATYSMQQSIFHHLSGDDNKVAGPAGSPLTYSLTFLDRTVRKGDQTVVV